MAVYIATWNLNKEGSGYNRTRSALLNMIERKYPRTIADKSLDTVRFISTDDSAKQIVDYLSRVLDENDGLLVLAFSPDLGFDGTIEDETWNWIVDELNS